MIVKTKFLCKGGTKRGIGHVGPIHGNPYHPLVHTINSNPVPATWVDTFIKGKWYDGEYETWNWEDGYRLNGGWRTYWVVNELGEKEEIPKAHMNVIFQLDISEIRDAKIDDILD